MVIVMTMAAGFVISLSRTPELVMVSSDGAFTETVAAQMSTAAADRMSLLKPAEMATFRGADEDGSLVMLNGHLLVNLNLRRWMDFYLSARGEQPLDQILAYMESRMQQLPAPASEEALNILHSYIAYLEDIDGYDEVTARKIEGSDLDSLRARMAWIEQMRRTHFSEAVVDAFFATEEALDRFTLKRLALREAGADDEALLAMEDELPVKLRIQRQQSRAVTDLGAMRRSAAGDEQALYRQQAERFGEAAANRLATLSVKRQDWNQRLDEYSRFLLSEPAPAALASYQQRHFNRNEIVRLDAALAVRRADVAIQ